MNSTTTEQARAIVSRWSEATNTTPLSLADAARWITTYGEVSVHGALRDVATARRQYTPTDFEGLLRGRLQQSFDSDVAAKLRREGEWPA